LNILEKNGKLAVFRLRWRNDSTWVSRLR